MSELTCLKLSVVLWIAHVLCQVGAAQTSIPLDYLIGPRDTPAVGKSLMFGRATRALANYVENLAPFVAMALGLIVTQRTGGLGATIWILARIAYLPLYLFGVPYLRSLAWGVALVGLLMMLAGLSGV